MERFFAWLADQLRPWYDNGLDEELRIPKDRYLAFERGHMARWARVTEGWDSPAGVFTLVGKDYVRRAARAWRPRERFLMEDLSLAFLDLEHHRQRGLRIDSIRFNRLVATLARYYAYHGETRTEGEVRALLQRYLDEHSVPESEQIELEEFVGIEVDLPLLEELHEIDAEMAELFPPRIGLTCLWDLGLRLDEDLDASRYEHITPLNCRTFASTGGDGVHFSFLVQDGVINSGSPVVLTVPSMGNLIVGETLFEFLCLGCRQGYGGMDGFAYNLEESLPAYLGSDRRSDGADNSTEWPEFEEHQRQLLDHLTTRLDLIPWTNPARFHELQADYAAELRMPPR